MRIIHQLQGQIEVNASKPTKLWGWPPLFNELKEQKEMLLNPYLAIQVLVWDGQY